jgi:hypothetical protein
LLFLFLSSINEAILEPAARFFDATQKMTVGLSLPMKSGIFIGNMFWYCDALNAARSCSGKSIPEMRRPIGTRLQAGKG